VLTLLWLTCAPALAAQPDPYVLGQSAAGTSLLAVTGHLVDPDGTLTLQDIRSKAVSDRFEYSGAPVQRDGGTQAIWFTLRFTQTQFNGHWLVATPFATLHDLQMFGPFDKTEVAYGEPVLTGSGKPFATRPLGNEKFVMPMTLDAPGEYVIYLRAVTKIPRTFEFKLWDASSYYAADNAKHIFDGLCYGVVIGMLIYNLMLSLVFRDQAYALYVASGVAALLSIISFNGHLAQYALPDLPSLAEIADGFFPGLWVAFGGWFAYVFLGLNRFSPWIGRGVLVTAFLGAAVSLVAAMGMHTLAQVAIERISMVGALLAVAGAISALRQGFRPAGLYLLGQIAVFLTVIIQIFNNWGWMDWPFIFDNGLQGSVAIQFVLFATALSSRIRLMHAANLDLTRKTEDLRLASETDPLTGLANRAGLASRARELLVNSRQRTLVMIDLDKFKPINDIHGHAAGDAILVEIAKRLREQVRPTDVVSRMGGDEFAILFSEPNDNATVGIICTRILAAMVKPLAFEGRTLAVGGSLGIARYPTDGNTLDDLLQAADVAMYHVKKNGRASFAFFENLSGKQAAEAVQSVAKDAGSGDDSVLFDV
jgi:diguanylate cyclase (GGDEF)-like protein